MAAKKKKVSAKGRAKLKQMLGDENRKQTALKSMKKKKASKR